MRQVERFICRSVLAGAFLLVCALPAAAQSDGQALIQRAAMSRAKGPAEAPVVVLEVADFQCPYCARFAGDVFPRLDSAYVRTGKVQWVFVNLPLPGHELAWAAAEAALCAGAAADRFWPMHDRLFAAQSEWSAAADPRDVFVRYARELGIPKAAFKACLLDDMVAPLILSDAIFGAARVNGTPAFLIGGENAEPVVGMKSYEELRVLIEAELARQR